ncbi:hypothetical protein [Gluconobacter oxydans]|nr:hypothetical protein [Gluconobacter oxydans]
MTDAQKYRLTVVLALIAAGCFVIYEGLPLTGSVLILIAAIGSGI